MITPFLMLVLAGFAVFVVSLGAVWIREFIADRRVASAADR